MCKEPRPFICHRLSATLALTLALVAPAEAYQVKLLWVQLDVVQKVSSIQPGEKTVYDGALYFQGTDGTGWVGLTNPTIGRELWKYDGTTISPAADIFPGPSGSSPSSLAVYDGVLYFRAHDGASGYELWKYDGTTASLVADIAPGSTSSFPGALTVYDGALYFHANDGTSGAELWKYDGTTASLVADITPGPGHSVPQNMIVYEGALYFEVKGGVRKYDGDTISAIGIDEIRPLAVYDGALYFGSGPSGGCPALCRFDGVTMSPATGLGPLQNGIVYRGTVSGGDLYLAARTAVYGVELWRYDGNIASLVGDLNPGPEDSHPLWLTDYNGTLYLSSGGPGPLSDHELYRGVSLVANINPGMVGMTPLSSFPEHLTVFNNWLYFSALPITGFDYGEELWRVRAGELVFSIYAELTLPYEKWWEFPIESTGVVDHGAGTLGFVAVAEGSVPRLLSRRPLLLNQPSRRELNYQSSLIDPVGMPPALAFVAVVFHDASGRIVASEVEVLSLEGEPDADLRMRLDRNARALLDSLTLEELNAMEVREFPAHQDEDEDERQPQPPATFSLLIAIGVGVLLIAALLTRALLARRAAS